MGFRQTSDAEKGTVAGLNAREFGGTPRKVTKAVALIP
jgi:hypothetical protein